MVFTFNPNTVRSQTKYSIAAQLLAQSQPEPPSPEEFIDSLDLDDEQRENIQEILDNYRPEVRKTFNKLQRELQNLRDTTVPTASADEIRIARQDVIHVRQQLGDLLFEELLAIRGELTVDQRGQINQRLQELYSQSN
ncbi:Spy/CpxP family protein refolding chaperone [Myxosarcina sp. GI1]|uniref:Spy/CpxP family protein refolding chaperone n=1 Tax=Myxosarcina sp. GI1 TaxID=1541065 RepID=UPI00155A2E22|nr:Spy/CpxP family protein refolding chaperone [Myxosarcina sp. GI1]